MNSYHATHPGPYADDCPECGGWATDPQPLDRHHSRDLVLLCLAGCVILVLLAWVTR